MNKWYSIRVEDRHLIVGYIYKNRVVKSIMDAESYKTREDAQTKIDKLKNDYVYTIIKL